MAPLSIAGRSSSHFTRVARVFAHELGVPYRFHVVLDLLSQSSTEYLGNPALRLPVLETEDGSWFGALNICRELARSVAATEQIVWPEQLPDRLSVNAQELVLQGMSTEVGLIMRKLATPDHSDRYEGKNRRSLEGSLTWLESHLPAVLERLPEKRRLSYLEVTAFCFVTHLEFRQVLDTSEYPALRTFCHSFAELRSASDTTYQFDHAS